MNKLLIFCLLVTAQIGLCGYLRKSGNAWVEPPPLREGKWDPTLFKTLTFGHLPASLDWLLMQNLLEYSTSRVAAGTHTSLYYDLRLIVQLDPLYFEVYLAGSNLLAVLQRDGEGAGDLLEKGMSVLKTELPEMSQEFREAFWPSEWRLPLTQGYVNLFERDDMRHASIAFREAAQMPGSPAYLKNLEKRLEKPGGEYEVGLKLLNFMIEVQKNEDIKKELVRKRNSLFIANYLFELNHSFINYLKLQPGYTNHHTLSKAQMESYFRLFRRWNHISEQDPWGGVISLNSEGQIVTSTRYERVFGLR